MKKYPFMFAERAVLQKIYMHQLFYICLYTCFIFAVANSIECCPLNGVDETTERCWLQSSTSLKQETCLPISGHTLCNISVSGIQAAFILLVLHLCKTVLDNKVESSCSF